MSVTDAQTTSEPYVGPRPFERGEADRFYGRDREVRRLLSLVVAHRVVLLYAASGAGKTSLLVAGLVPELEAGEGFEVLPVARVQGADLGEAPPAANVYALGVLSNWDAAGETLAGFLASRERAVVDGLPAPRAIVIDQLEEVFTLYPEHWRQRPAFFEQLAAALAADPSLRVVLAIREDYVAQLDPFAALLGGLRTRLRLEPLRHDAALLAVSEPLTGTARSFADGVAERLVDDLQRIRVEAPTGGSAEVEGEFVEPVQLQVACHSLWHALPPDVDVITFEHLEAFGDVDQVLARYYDEAVAEAARTSRLRELTLRDRLEQAFITPAGTRGTAYAEADATAGIPDTVIRELENRHLLRAERTRGARWYELTHDRLIEPIRASNRRARQERDRRRRRRYGRTILALALLAAAAAAVAAVALGRDEGEAGPQGDVPPAVVAAEVNQAQRLLVDTLRGHKGSVMSAHFSATGSLVVTAAKDRRAIVWRTDTGETIADLPGDGPLNIAAFDPSSERLVTAGDDGVVRLWTWTGLQKLPPGPVTRAVRAETSTRFSPPGPAVLDAEFSPGGRFLAAVNRAGQARIYRVANGDFEATLTHDAPITSVGFHSDGEVLVTASGDGRATVWSWRDKRVLKRIPHPGVRTAAFSPDGRLVVTAGAMGVRLWEWRTGKLWAVVRSGPALDASFSPDGRQIVTALRAPRAEIWDLPLAKGRPTRSAQLGGHEGAVTSASFSREGLAVTASEDGTARLWSPYGDLDVESPLPIPLQVTSGFGEDRTRIGGGALAANGRRYHGGVDFRTPPRIRVRAPVTGRVVESRGTGITAAVTILAGDGKVWNFLYAEPLVKRGATVRSGQAIAVTSHEVPFIHIDVRKTRKGGYRFENLLDPMIFFRKR